MQNLQREGRCFVLGYQVFVTHLSDERNQQLSRFRVILNQSAMVFREQDTSKNYEKSVEIYCYIGKFNSFFDRNFSNTFC